MDDTSKSISTISNSLSDEASDSFDDKDGSTDINKDTHDSFATDDHIMENIYDTEISELNTEDNITDQNTDADVDSDCTESEDCVSEISDDCISETNEEQFDELSTTLKEIDDSLNQDNADQLVSRINASSDFLRQLLIKQKRSHQKIQKMQANIQNRDVQVNMLEGENLESSFDSDCDVSLSQYFLPPLQQHQNQDEKIDEKLKSEVTTEDKEEQLIDCIETNPLDSSDKRIIMMNSLQTTSDEQKMIINNDEKNKTLENTRTQDININDQPYSISPTNITQDNSTSQQESSSEDNLMLFFDYMAAHIKEQRLEQERIKLDVIVALRTKLQDIYEGESIEKIPAKFIEKLNESLYKILCAEVKKVKTEEEEKFYKRKENYEKDIEKLSIEIETLARERCETNIKLKCLRDQLVRHKENVEKSDHYENRVEYLENLLRSVEQENERYKHEINQIRNTNGNLNEKLKKVQNELDSSTRNCTNLISSEEVSKKRFQNEIQKLVEQNKQLNEQLFGLQNGLHEVTTERNRIANSKETDLTIIKHLEQKLEKQESVLDSMTTNSKNNSEKCKQYEAKAIEYKQKLKKCLHVLEISRKQHRKITENVKRVEEERDAFRRSLNEIKIKQSEIQINHVRERTDLEEKINVLQSNLKLSKEKLFSVERSNQHLKQQLNILHTSSDRLLPDTLKTGIEHRSFPIGYQSDYKNKTLTPSSPNKINVLKQQSSNTTNRSELGCQGSEFHKPLTLYSPKTTTPSVSMINSRLSNLENIPPQSKPQPIKLNDIGKRYCSENTKLFLKEMSHKLENKENRVKLTEELLSPLEQSQRLKDEMESVRSQVMKLS